MSLGILIFALFVVFMIGIGAIAWILDGPPYRQRGWPRSYIWIDSIERWIRREFFVMSLGGHFRILIPKTFFRIRARWFMWQ